MKSNLLALAAAVSLAFAAAAPAGTLEPALQQAVTQVGVDVDLPVIVQFAEQVDKAALRAEANRLAWELYPDDPKKRNKARRKLLRKMLIDALKDQAKSSKKQVKDFLKSYKENRKLKLLWARNSVVGDVPAYLLEDLAAQPGVEEVKLDAKLQGPGPSTPPTAPTFWNLPATGVDELWNLGHTGLGVVVATLDTGVDAAHPDLGPKWRGGSNDWLDPYEQHASPADNNGHGTRVMGLIVGGAALGYQIGMAPDAQWIAAKIFDDSNQATLSGIHAAYQWVLDPDGNSATDDAPHIVNNSWDLANTVNQCNQEFAEDLALLTASDIAVVFAGGNYGPNPETSVSPANDPAVLAVGGVDSALNIDVQSSRGPGACDGGVFPHLVAPGDNVLTADLVPTYYNWVSGTSFAVAHVAGGMAVLKGAFADASASQLRASLIDTTGDLGAAGPDDTYGHGMIDLAGAYARLEAELGGSPGSLQLGAADYSVDEGVASLTVTVTRSGGSSGDVSVDYATSDGTAIAGEDYSAAAGTLSLLDGEVSATFTIDILDDTLVEGDEDLTVTLSNATGAALGTPANAPVTILDDDALDSDGDGVSDALDLCANTPAGEPVDASGCSASQLDADGDGVGNLLDQCPNTPTGEAVDADGCSASQLDGDSDGVSDALDQCPNTPLGEAVDAAGCAASQLDGDSDGVSDALDLCPNTPAGEAVDAAGCSASQLDGDSDGVSDALDQCPSTPPGEAVDANGCTIVSGPLDADGDGFTADVDCNDGDNSIYPGAPEIKHDGVDQDCNGYDLTIDITKATYQASTQKVLVYANSALDGDAALKITYHGAGGETLTRNMTWNASKGRWQKVIKNFVSSFGFVPVSVTVAGPEGSETANL